MPYYAHLWLCHKKNSVTWNNYSNMKQIPINNVFQNISISPHIHESWNNKMWVPLQKYVHFSTSLRMPSPHTTLPIWISHSSEKTGNCKDKFASIFQFFKYRKKYRNERMRNIYIFTFRIQVDYNYTRIKAAGNY